MYIAPSPRERNPLVVSLGFLAIKIPMLPHGYAEVTLVADESPVYPTSLALVSAVPGTRC